MANMLMENVNPVCVLVIHGNVANSKPGRLMMSFLCLFTLYPTGDASFSLHALRCASLHGHAHT